jgi:hypothetical protein
MSRNPVLDLPLTAIMKDQIALPLQHVMHLYTVGSFLTAWKNPKNHRSIEQLFDTPQQARHAVAICAAWLGVRSAPLHSPIKGWWQGDAVAALPA